MIMLVVKEKEALVLLMKNKFSVRRMVTGDIDIVKKIYSQAFGKQVSSVIDYTNEDIYVVCLDDEIAGMCMVDYIDDIFISRRTALVNGVCVGEEYRGKGIATFMLGEIEKLALEDGCTEIMLTSSSKRVCANELYKKLGFEIKDTNVFKKKI